MAEPRTTTRPRNTPSAPSAPSASAPDDDTLTQTRIAALEAQLAAAQAALSLQAVQQQQQPTRDDPTKMYVGIRSASNNTIGLPKSPVANDPEVTLHAPSDVADPNTVAVISYPHWLQLRKHKYYDWGLFVRDDSVLGPTHQAAPPDEPSDLAPQHAVNLVLDPFEWIASKSEKQLKDAVQAMTSEASLRRLNWAVQQEVNRFFMALPENDPDRVEKAENSLSAKMQYVERLVDMRLMELTAPYRATELEG
jgi:hypothetical protein